MGVVLALNAGSSSLKYALFGDGDPPPRLVSGKIERVADAVSALDPILKQVATSGKKPVAVGHRIVHGGPKYVTPARITADVLAELRRMSPFDPEHLPAEISIIEAVTERFPGLPQVACFDTAFHRDLPRVSRILPIPRKYEAAGVRRYGFHGLSYEYLVDQLRREPGGLPRRVVLAHLGNGASLAAVLDGTCVDTTMGFTPTAGVPMSRRSGDLDPGLVDYLARTEGMTPAQFHDMVNTRSGLLGISETSSDVRDLLAKEKDDPRAAEALAVFCHRVKQAIGAFAATLGGLDLLVFSGGIGENAAVIRERIGTGLEFLGAAVRVLKTDEELQIARLTRGTLGL
jgi:acetate kinase